MFGFFKKKQQLTDRLVGGISIEVGMFESWTMDKRHKTLSQDELGLIVDRILNREGLKVETTEVEMLKMMLLMNDMKQMEEFRRKTNFDIKVEGFCKSINLPSEYYTPK